MPACRFLADLLISFFNMAITNTMVQPVIEADFAIAGNKLMRSFVKNVAPFRRHPQAHALGPCLLSSSLQNALVPVPGSNWQPVALFDGKLEGMQGAGQAQIQIDATDAVVGGIAVWVESEGQVKVQCISGVFLQTARNLQVFLTRGSLQPTGCRRNTCSLQHCMPRSCTVLWKRVSLPLGAACRAAGCFFKHFFWPCFRRGQMCVLKPSCSTRLK